ncbi:MAG TPA: YdeI/OmpD-associated family protein [Patescibacteria group bacterium]|nr:YdeI/OmpD-associated family protein [Patescibacteria group bacterium]
MTKNAIASGTVHRMPPDLKRAIVADREVLAIWQDITPLARNEWICWVEDAKKDETRTIRIEKALSKMRGGMRRPCCWAGCMHRVRNGK